MQVVELESVRRFKTAREKAGIREYSFRNTYELVEFLSSEIRSSKFKYARLAEKAGCCPATVGKIADRTTRSPHNATVMNLLKALGFEIFVRG